MKAFMTEAMRKKSDKKSSFSPAILLKLYVLIILYVVAMTNRSVYVASLNPFVNQKKVPNPLGKHRMNTLAMKMCSVANAVTNSMAAMNPMIWLKMDLFWGSPPNCS